MDPTTAEEIRKLKDDLARRAAAAESALALAGGPFAAAPEDLTDRELDAFVRDELAALEREAPIRLDPRAVKTHRNRLLMAPVVALKRALMRAVRFYGEMIVHPASAFHERTALALRALAEQARRDREARRAIEERVSRCEEKLTLILARLEDRRTRPEA